MAIALAVRTLALAPPALAQAARIESITPACAGVGEQVVITGSGFGAKNVKITVGTVPAQVIAATGSKATLPRSSRRRARPHNRHRDEPRGADREHRLSGQGAGGLRRFG